MRRLVLTLTVLLLGLVAGCGQAATPSPSPSPSPSPPLPSPTAASETGGPSATASATPSGPATCQVFNLAVESRIPPVGEEDHVYGPVDAPITFIEYADFQCPACARLDFLREFLEEVHGDEIRFVYRHLPLISIHDKAIVTGEAAEAAAAQGKFWEMHDLLYDRQQEWHSLSEDEIGPRLIEYAEELGLDIDRFARQLDDGVYREELMADYEEYKQYGQMATPTYVVNNIFYPTRQIGLSPPLIDGFIGLILMKPDQYGEVPPQVVDPEKDYVATLRTGKGDIVVELFADRARTNVNSFAFLAQDGWYDGQAFFYVDPESLALSGDPTNTGAGLPYPGYYCGAETTPDLTFDEAGMLALYAPAPGRNSSSFFITYAPQPDFNGKFTIIGRVIEGMGVAESLTPTQPGADQPEPDVLDTVLIEER